MGLAVALFAMIAEGLLPMRNFHIFHLAATRDLLRIRYFLEIECPEIFQQKKKEAEEEASRVSLQEAFFIVSQKGGVQEISQQEFDSGQLANEDTLFVRLNWNMNFHGSANSIFLPIRLRFERYLHQGKRRSYEIHTAVFLF